MPQLLTDSKIGSAIEELIDNADVFLWLVSPYIKLHDRIKDKLKSVTRRKPDIKVVVIFGKNEDNVSKSMSREDIEFLKALPDIHIGYEPRLHAKFYASEDCCIVTSMNLHQFSQNTNIEVAIKLESKKWLKQLGGNSSIENEVLTYFDEVIENAKTIFAKEAKGKSNMFGLQQNYSHSEIVIDETESFFKQKDFVPRQVYKRPAPVSTTQNNGSGYCIRTGKPIPFDTKKPLSDAALKSWSLFKNPDYPEKYCHFSGEPTNGETSVSKPILRKNWSKAKEQGKL